MKRLSKLTSKAVKNSHSLKGGTIDNNGCDHVAYADGKSVPGMESLFTFRVEIIRERAFSLHQPKPSFQKLKRAFHKFAIALIA